MGKNTSNQEGPFHYDTTYQQLHLPSHLPLLTPPTYYLDSQPKSLLLLIILSIGLS